MFITPTDGTEGAKRIELVGVWPGSDGCEECPYTLPTCDLVVREIPACAIIG